MGVDGVERGTLVALYPYGGCGSCERCATGNETLCRDARLDGVNAPGILQSHFLAWARDAVAVPAPIGARMAAIAPTLAVAWHVLVCRGGFARGETAAI
jgi:D-arabinose 1-dehydrogenase-like Zn-dependent alcohol dehydrogenase